MEEANNQSKKWEQEEISNEMNNWELTEEESVDWRGRPSNPKHGGTRAALFVLGTLSLSKTNLVLKICF